MNFKIGDYVEVVGNFLLLDERGQPAGRGSIYGVINGYDENHLFVCGRAPAYNIAYDHDPKAKWTWTRPEHLRHANLLDRLASLAPKGDRHGKVSQHSR